MRKKQDVLGFFTSLAPDNLWLLENIDESNLKLESPELIECYKQHRLTKDIKELFRKFFKIEGHGFEQKNVLGSFILFYSKLRQARATGVEFGFYIQSEPFLSFNPNCIKDKNVLISLVAGFYGINLETNSAYQTLSLEVKRAVHTLAEDIEAVEEKVKLISGIKKTDLVVHGGFDLVRERFIRDVNLQYSKVDVNKIRKDAQPIMEVFLKYQNYNQLAELSTLLAQQQWHTANQMIKAYQLPDKELGKGNLNYCLS